MSERATVHLLCGFNGAGKSTLARQLETSAPAVRFSLDEWMLRLFGLAYDHPDYPTHAEAVRLLVWDTAQQVLATGTDVVLDWNCWNALLRATWARRAREAGAACVVHHVTTPLEECLVRLAERRDPAAHVLDPDGATRLALELFEAPAPAEGLEVRTS